MKARELEKVRKAALEVSLEAGDTLMKFYRKRLNVREKARSSLVTEADLTSEALIRRRLEKKFPSFRFLGEESGALGGDDEDLPLWHVDPLDGTTNFVHGFPMFCVSIGLALRNEPLVGVIHIPTVGDTFHGAKGAGALFNRSRMRVSKRKKLSESVLTTGFAYIRNRKQLAPEIRRFQDAHLQARAVRRPGAAAIDLAYVAAGVFDAFWERNLASWDVCAGSLLVQEAGGKVTSFDGKPFSLQGPEILATNGLLHPPMRKILR